MPTVPVPISQHKARGTYRKTRHGGKLVVESGPLGDAPEWFDEVQRGEWNRLVVIDHIRAMNRTAVEHACILYGRFIEDAKGIAGFRPMTASERACFHSVYMQLGLTPASAAKIPAQPAKKTDEWAQFG